MASSAGFLDERPADVSVPADAVVVVHVAFVMFVVLGGLLVLRWPRLIWMHLPAALWGVWIEIAGWVCPLTPLENRLRAAAGEAGYTTSFVEHYVVPILYPAGLTREGQWALAAIVLAVNAGVYTLVFRRHRKRADASPVGRPD
jgi:hypothetical protein